MPPELVRQPSRGRLLVLVPFPGRLEARDQPGGLAGVLLAAEAVLRSLGRQRVFVRQRRIGAFAHLRGSGWR